MADEIKQEQKLFRGVVIHIPEEGRFGIQISGEIKLLEIYGALTILMKQVEKDLGINK
jgi:hypothetical protein